MKKLILSLCVALLLVSGLPVPSAAAEPQLRQDFEVGDVNAVFSAAREKFMNYPERSVVEDYKSFFEKSAVEYFMSACRGEHGDWIAFIVPMENVPDGYSLAVFLYPDLDLLTIGDEIIEPDQWDAWYERINEELNPDSIYW